MRIFPSTLLVALCLLQAAALASLWMSSKPEWNPPAPQALPDTLFLTLAPRAAAPSVADTTPDKHSAIATRPLFSAGRRPATQTAAPAHAATRDDIALIGVFSTESAGGAILMIDGAARRIRTGERIGGLTLLAVDDTHARFVAEDGNGFELELQRRLLLQAADPGAGADDGSPRPDTADAHHDEAD